jgi:hypothetical protein
VYGKSVWIMLMYYCNGLCELPRLFVMNLSPLYISKGVLIYRKTNFDVMQDIGVPLTGVLFPLLQKSLFCA